jgi:hypothetical protein
MQVADAVRRVVPVARAIIEIGLFVALLYLLLAAPGLLSDDASTVPVSPAEEGASP